MEATSSLGIRSQSGPLAVFLLSAALRDLGGRNFTHRYAPRVILLPTVQPNYRISTQNIFANPRASLRQTQTYSQAVGKKQSAKRQDLHRNGNSLVRRQICEGLSGQGFTGAARLSLIQEQVKKGKRACCFALPDIFNKQIGAVGVFVRVSTASPILSTQPSFCELLSHFPGRISLSYVAQSNDR